MILQGLIGGWNHPGARSTPPTRTQASLYQQGARPDPHDPSLNSLVKIGEKVDSEGVLLVKLVAVGIFHGIQGVGGRRVLQEDVAEATKRAMFSVHF